MPLRKPNDHKDWCIAGGEYDDWSVVGGESVAVLFMFSFYCGAVDHYHNTDFQKHFDALWDEIFKYSTIGDIAHNELKMMMDESGWGNDTLDILSENLTAGSYLGKKLVLLLFRIGCHLVDVEHQTNFEQQFDNLCSELRKHSIAEIAIKKFERI